MTVFFRATAVAGAMAAATLGITATRAAASPLASPAVLHVGQIDRQDLPAAKGCEPDTVVEPDIAVSPSNANIEVAAAHDCRFSNGGALDISYAWTHDGGAHWHHEPLPGLTKAVGGVWDRASDPVVAFGPDGSVYIAALVLDLTCPGGVTISRSTDGGETFAPPILVHESNRCDYSDDKDWLVVDRQHSSPFYGRLYVFWTPFISRKGSFVGSPQVVRWSDDKGKTWSSTHMVTPITSNDQNSQPMIQPDGTITDVYMHFPNATSNSFKLMARRSIDGGSTWSQAYVVAAHPGFGPNDVRCCLPASNADFVTGRMYTAWLANAPGEAVELSSSTDGRHWSAPVTVSRDNRAVIDHINVAVDAYNGNVYVTYGTRNTKVDGGRYVQQQLSTSRNGGASFGATLSLGPLSDLKYAAVSGAPFPGDYIGISATAAGVAAAWCVSSTPPNPSATYHQVVYAAELGP